MDHEDPATILDQLRRSYSCLAVWLARNNRRQKKADRRILLAQSYPADRPNPPAGTNRRENKKRPAPDPLADEALKIVMRGRTRRTRPLPSRPHFLSALAEARRAATT
jgi:hypothetical protein